MFIGSNDLVAKKSVKSLGFWWSWDLSAKVAIDEAAKKARRAFFMHSSQVFQGLLNPLSGRALFEACIVPIFLYGCVNWVPTTSLLTQLEQFQGEIARRILKLSKNHSAISCTSVAARGPLLRSCVII